jgi:hypothetical protein
VEKFKSPSQAYNFFVGKNNLLTKLTAAISNAKTSSGLNFKIFSLISMLKSQVFIFLKKKLYLFKLYILSKTTLLKIKFFFLINFLTKLIC